MGSDSSKFTISVSMKSYVNVCTNGISNLCKLPNIEIVLMWLIYGYI